MNLQGKRILVTGVSAGIGVETARSLAAHGAHVVGAARDLTKAEASKQIDRLQEKTGRGTAKTRKPRKKSSAKLVSAPPSA